MQPAYISLVEQSRHIACGFIDWTRPGYSIVLMLAWLGFEQLQIILHKTIQAQSEGLCCTLCLL